jgi:hypothetical protein
VRPDEVEDDVLSDRIRAENDYDRQLYEHAEKLLADRSRDDAAAPGSSRAPLLG